MRERYNDTELVGILAHQLQEAVKDCTLDSVVGNVEEHREELKRRTMAHFNSNPHGDKGIQTCAEPDALDDDVIRVYVKPPRVADRINILFELKGPELVPSVEHTIHESERPALTREALAKFELDPEGVKTFYKERGGRSNIPAMMVEDEMVGAHMMFPPGSSSMVVPVARELIRLRGYQGLILDLVAGVWVLSSEGNPKPQEVVDIWVAGGRIPNVTHIADGMYQMGCGPTHADAWLRPIRPDGLPLR